MEIAVEPEIHTYSGGLGVLAGDTARTCADLQLPMIFISLVSRQGYLKQEIDAEGHQIEHPDPWAPDQHAVSLRAKVAVQIEGREVWVRPWLYVMHSEVGNSLPVLLLDTDLPENDEHDRGITDFLYGGDEAYRLKQEIVLGIGGMRLLQALGFTIEKFHLNEGHAALLALDILRRFPKPEDLVLQGEIGFDIARARESCIFTTHTPVEAAHDRFPYDLVDRLLGDYIDVDQLRLIAGDDCLNMTRLALNLSEFVNGVAGRHAETATQIFPEHDIRAITNGVHLETWVHSSFAQLFDQHLPQWRLEPDVLVRADQLPNEAVWTAHQVAKRDLIEMVKAVCGVDFSLKQPLIGFARRMTAYKRPDLLFSDLDRLTAIHGKHPFQIVMAGKAHPHDHAGKHVIKTIHDIIREFEGRIHIAFLPNYDMEMAKPLVAGVDVWLNTPTPPMEASGTSGMKAALNGCLNLSVLDGWWVEACIEGCTGWAIGHDGTGGPSATASDLYNKLEEVVLPLYFEEGDGWVWMMKEAISKIPYFFNTHRMMRRYVSEAYVH